MKYLVDTDWVIDYLTGQKEAGDLFETLLPSGIALSIITFYEDIPSLNLNQLPLLV